MPCSVCSLRLCEAWQSNLVFPASRQPGRARPSRRWHSCGAAGPGEGGSRGSRSPCLSVFGHRGPPRGHRCEACTGTNGHSLCGPGPPRARSHSQTLRLASQLCAQPTPGTSGESQTRRLRLSCSFFRRISLKSTEAVYPAGYPGSLAHRRT